MYLKSIEMHGFKSFANKIVLEFHDGITGIVGPNGSGKSNVGDAVRWVLGEQSAKQLRGGNMQDVIFSGTEARKPLGYASVAITLDNSDHKLNIDFEEVTVTRRLYRSGESEYLLNGSSCRLKDINELFYDTGIGKEGYSIIGQGQIDKILSGKPEERRELFDEAAGIVKFKRRKSTALKKLAEEQQNLVRVTDILSELTRQLGPLERQSESARIYLKKKEELKKLDINLFLLEMERIEEQIAQVSAKYEASSQELQESNRNFEQTRQEYEKLEDELDDLDGKIQSARDQTSQNTLMKQQLESQIELLKEQIHTARMNHEHYKTRITAIQEELERRTEARTGYQKEQENLDICLAEVSEKKTSKERELEELQKKIEENHLAVENGKNDIIEILNKRGSIKGKIQRYDAMLEQIGIRKAELNQKLLRLKSDEAQQVNALEELQAAYQDIKEQVRTVKEEYEEADRQIAGIQALLTEQTRQMEVGQTAYHREESRLESLKNITERYGGYGNSIRKVMEQKDRNPGIHGVVADLFKTQKQYETALETALGGSIQNIVTDNENTAKYLIEYLKRGRFGRATFLPLTSMNRKQAFINEAALKEAGVIGIAANLVEYDSIYEGLCSHLLGRTLVVDTIDHAIALGRKYKQSIRMVTLEGELLSPGGSMSGGAFRNNSNLLGRRREIEELESSVKALKKDMDAVQSEIMENRGKRNRLRDDRTEINEKLQQLYLRQNTAKINMSQAREKTVDLQSGFTELQKEALEIEAQIGEIGRNKRIIEEELEVSKKMEDKLGTEISARQEELDAQIREENDKNKILESIRLEFANVKQKYEFLQLNLQRLDDEIMRFRKEEAQINHAMEEESGDIGKKEGDILEVQKTIEAAGQAGEENTVWMQQLLKKKEELNQSHKSFFEKREELSKHINLMDKECFRLNSHKEKLEETKETRINYMWEEYEITPGHARSWQMEEPVEAGEIRRQVAVLKDDIRKLGPVNVNAIEDFKEIQERHTFLQNQHTDLVKAAETLQGIIDELDTGMRRQFTEKFQEIKIEFDKAFKQLFGGGKGTLELTEDEDVLEAGIRIISQPPGKKLQNMMQLSGGEKALTAIALLFAIQNLKPSPFCLLDEIEAALDDSNVTRFAQYLHKLTKNTQFIIITHRRGTMNAADRLYGITMQEKGVSTLVSVNLIENELDK
ncbi:chromosome segregation protein SMC [Novisyntrophococcus fermenticellae]|uniref:chromosome segregation protein SMC n=1 Tax=Novisyntrophococcus fermenticellae TaxID=2068655 RepID=UPI001E512DC3|nr:chromosome segregation protein SMC [Novisyntrophococcus fermenticellae]